MNKSNSDNLNKIESDKRKIKTIPWIEKYRPPLLNKIISHDNIKDALNKFIQKKTLPNIILYGSSGIGKTSLIRACANELYGQYVDIMALEINASEERGIEIVRNTITQFASSIPSFNWSEHAVKYTNLVILDEVDSMTFEAQIALRNVIDLYSKTTRFCLICNCIQKIHRSLVSRCVKFRMHPLQNDIVFEYARNICEIEKINITDDALNEIIKCACGDMRKVINVLQSIYTTYKSIDKSCVNMYMNKIQYPEIKKIIKSIFNDNILDASKIINSIMESSGCSIQNIVSNVSDVLLQYVNKTINDDDICDTLKYLNNNKIFEIIKKLGKIEFQIFSNISIDILIITFISSCKLI